MLSVGKLGPGRAAYYLNTVAAGAEDYAAGTAEAPGTWLGSGLADLDLAAGARVDETTLGHVLAAQHPSTGAPLLTARRCARTIPGFDTTCSSPKSVSVIYGLGETTVRRAVAEAHHAAVVEAFAWLEARTALAKRGWGGERGEVETTGLLAAAFPHRTSRAGDPQLHTHVLVANLVHAPEDQQWSALGHRRLYANARTGGFLYEAELRARLTESLGVAWTPAEHGIADIAGVPPELLRSFSKRRVEIEEEMAARGEHSARAAQTATLTTRRPKSRTGHTQRTAWSTDARDYEVDPAADTALAQRWRAEALAIGYLPDRLVEALDREVLRAVDGTRCARPAKFLRGGTG